MYEIGYHADDHYIKCFESLPVTGLLQLSEERVNEIRKYANRIVDYHSAKKEAASVHRRYFSPFLGLQEKYHIALSSVNRLKNNFVYFKDLKAEIVLKNDEEKALLGMLICDSECKYYDLYESKRREGLSDEQALDYLQMYFGFKSPKLVQIERYYKLLNYRFAKKTGIFDNFEDSLKR